jgi:hypothetical protein
MSTKEDAEAVLDVIQRSQLEILDLTFELEEDSSESEEESFHHYGYDGNPPKRSPALEVFEEHGDDFDDSVLEKLRVFRWDTLESVCDHELPSVFFRPSLERIAVTLKSLASSGFQSQRSSRFGLMKAIKKDAPNIKSLTVFEDVDASTPLRCLLSPLP